MIIGPSAVIPGYVLKSIPNSAFTMAEFSDRLRLQKLIYLVEAFGVYLGYDYSWYLRGPYCTSLARSGFELEQIVGRIPDGAEARFLSRDVQERFDRCVEFVGSIMKSSDDLDRLEIAASIHLLAQDAKIPKEGVFERVVAKMPGGEDRRAELLGMCEGMWDALLARSLIPGREGAHGPGGRPGGPAEAGYRVTAAPASIDQIRDSMIGKQRYGDAAMAVTLKDLYDNGQALEANSPPPFTHSPDRIAQLESDPKRNEILSFVMRQYR